MKRLAGIIGMLLWMLGVSGQQAAVPGSAAFMQERMYLHIDKTQYLAGEIAWFKAYLVDAVSKQPSGRSKVAYVEIIDQENNAVLQAKIDMQGGVGAGSIMIPVNMKTGNYIVRSYTAWMKNFSPIHFFRQPVTVYNTFKTYQADSLAATPFHVDFFPESGALISNLKSLVAFRAYNVRGQEAGCSGEVVDDLNQRVAVFSAGKTGLGAFEFTPVAGRRYYATARTIDGLENKFSLPSVADTGYVMHVIKGSEELRVDIAGNRLMDDHVLLVVHQDGRAGYSQRVSLSNSIGTVRCPISVLQDGVNTMTLFNSDGVPMAERLVFRLPDGHLPLKVSAGKKVYGLREKVQVSVTATKGSSLSASVAQQIPDGASAVDIFSSVWLGSEMHGLNRSLASFMEAGTDSSAILDQLMLTFGYRKILRQKQAPVVRFLPEIEGHIVEGTVTDTRTGKPASHVMTYLSIPGPNPGFYCSESALNGEIRFIVKEYFGSRELIVQTDYRKDSTYKIEIRSPFASAVESANRFRYDTSLEPWLERSALAVQVTNQFNEEHLRTFYDRVADSSMFYIKPTDSYLLDEYKRFTTMDEVLREYVPGVVVRRRNGRNEVDIVNYEMKTLFDDPLLLIDGVPIFNSESILKQDPLKIRKLQVVNNRFVHGPAVFNGISNWQTYRGDLDGFTADPRAMVVDYEGLQLQRQFYSPVYETPEQRHSRLPDYRTVLSWNPFLTAVVPGPATFSFFTSDQPGTYEVVVHGMDAAGKMGSGTITFEVK